VGACGRTQQFSPNFIIVNTLTALQTLRLSHLVSQRWKYHKELSKSSSSSSSCHETPFSETPFAKTQPQIIPPQAAGQHHHHHQRQPQQDCHHIIPLSWVDFLPSCCFVFCPFGFFVLACVLSPALGVCVYLLLPLELLFLLFYARTICILII